jgi:hypothetical protein
METVFMTRKDRLLLFLYSTPNIVGCLLGLLGLALYFTGVIQEYWFPIVIGLYLIGIFVTPRPERVELELQNELSNEEIERALSELVRKVQKRLPPETLAKVKSIQASILSILPLMAANSGDQNSFVLRQTALEYLPTALENYLNLPSAFANVHPIRDGKPARQLLNEQLDLLEQEMQELVTAAAANDTQKLLAHGRFLEQKFQKDDLFAGWVAPQSQKMG